MLNLDYSFIDNESSQDCTDYTVASQTSEDESEEIRSQCQLDNLSPEDFLNIFFKKEIHTSKDEDKFLDQKIYFTDESRTRVTKENNIQIQSQITSNPKIDIFEVTYSPLQKKRGRQANENGGKKPTHDKNSTDNLKRKIQVHYMSFIIDSINDIIKQLGYEEEFLNLDYNYKKNVSNTFFLGLKKKKISDIISNNISEKYSTKDTETNINLHKKLKNDKRLKKIFDENYLLFFKNIYFNFDDKINFIKYGLDKDIILSRKVERYKDLIKDATNDYAKNLNSCVAQNYLPQQKVFIPI